jgi:UDP-glucuronate decarboxylase
MKKVIIAGGAGFIGYHLCKRMLDKNCDVICVDNLITGSLHNMEKWLKHPHFKFIAQDIREPLQLEAQEIYNLACPASPKAYQQDPLFTLDTNYLGTKNLLELAKKNKALFFQASTSEIYGDPQEHPQKESYQGNVNCCGLRACYDEGKRVAETLCFEYSRLFGLDIKVARIFNTYGPKMKQDDGRAVSNFIVQAILHKELTIYGDGTQTRSFCYVEDLIQAIERLMRTPAVKEPINLGNPEEISILELAKKIIKQCKSSSTLSFFPIDQDDPKLRRPDITQAMMLLGWQPQTSIDQGIAFTIKDFLIANQ